MKSKLFDAVLGSTITETILCRNRCGHYEPWKASGYLLMDSVLNFESLVCGACGNEYASLPGITFRPEERAYIDIPQPPLG